MLVLRNIDTESQLKVQHNFMPVTTLTLHYVLHSSENVTANDQDKLPNKNKYHILSDNTTVWFSFLCIIWTKCLEKAT